MAADRSKGRALSSFDTSRWPRAVRRRPPPSSTIAEVEEEEEASGFRGVAAAEAASAAARQVQEEKEKKAAAEKAAAEKAAAEKAAAEKAAAERAAAERALKAAMPYPFKLADPAKLQPAIEAAKKAGVACLLYTSPSPRDGLLSRMPSSA